MTSARTCLLDALHHVVAGGDFGCEDLDAVALDPSALDRAERMAWEQLSHWAEDVDIREQHDRYAEFKRDRIRKCIVALKADRH